MNTGAVIDLKTFVPSKDHAKSTEFYKDLGFTLNWDAGHLKEFQVGAFRFLLQDFYVEDWANNFMMHLHVENVETWWTHIQDTQLAERYAGVRASPPAMQDYGMRMLFLVDPAGVLWHIAELPKNQP